MRMAQRGGGDCVATTGELLSAGSTFDVRRWLRVLFNALRGIPRQLRARSARMINIINARVRGSPAVLSLSLSLSLSLLHKRATRRELVALQL